MWPGTTPTLQSGPSSGECPALASCVPGPPAGEPTTHHNHHTHTPYPTPPSQTPAPPHLQAAAELAPNVGKPAVPGAATLAARAAASVRTAAGHIISREAVPFMPALPSVLACLCRGGQLVGVQGASASHTAQLLAGQVSGRPYDEAPLHHAHQLHILCRSGTGGRECTGWHSAHGTRHWAEACATTIAITHPHKPTHKQRKQKKQQPRAGCRCKGQRTRPLLLLQRLSAQHVRIQHQRRPPRLIVHATQAAVQLGADLRVHGRGRVESQQGGPGKLTQGCTEAGPCQMRQRGMARPTQQGMLEAESSCRPLPKPSSSGRRPRQAQVGGQPKASGTPCPPPTHPTPPSAPTRCASAGATGSLPAKHLASKSRSRCSMLSTCPSSAPCRRMRSLQRGWARAARLASEKRARLCRFPRSAAPRPEARHAPALPGLHPAGAMQGADPT